MCEETLAKGKNSQPNRQMMKLSLHHENKEKETKGDNGTKANSKTCDQPNAEEQTTRVFYARGISSRRVFLFIVRTKSVRGLNC